jgi:transcriptional regulator of arginine metabolism
MTRSGRAERQRQLLHLLETERFTSQEALATALSAKGFRVSQATLSRDLREIGAVRVAGPDGPHYALPREEPAARGLDLMALEVTGVEANESIVIVKTWPGRAQGVGQSLDNLHLEDILGTVAGDDTILVVPRSTRNVKRLRRRIEDIVRAGQPDATAPHQKRNK